MFIIKLFKWFKKLRFVLDNNLVTIEENKRFLINLSEIYIIYNIL